MLYLQLYFLRSYFNKRAVGAAQQNISKEKVAEAPILIPSQKLRDDFDRVVCPLFGLIRSLTRVTRNLKQQRDLLLPKLISGEVNVSEASTADEAAAA
jgi:type I restriction enzyme S subunit